MNKKDKLKQEIMDEIFFHLKAIDDVVYTKLTPLVNKRILDDNDFEEVGIATKLFIDMFVEKERRREEALS